MFVLGIVGRMFLFITLTTFVALRIGKVEM
jgi:hypothetical protein